MTYVNIRKIATSQDDYTTSCLLGYLYFKKYNFIEINLSKEQAFDAEPKAIQQFNFTPGLRKLGSLVQENPHS